MRRFTITTLMLALLSAFVVAPLSTSHAISPQPGPSSQTTPSPFQNIPITGTFTDALGGKGVFKGTTSITQFALRNGQLVAVTTVTGTLTDSLGVKLGDITKTVRRTVGIDADCEILHLDLGPLDLNLLGLRVQLSRIILDITAEPGPGNLLGNLLCAIAHLLDPGFAANPTSLERIVYLLNWILELHR